MSKGIRFSKKDKKRKDEMKFGHTYKNGKPLYIFVRLKFIDNYFAKLRNNKDIFNKIKM